MSARISVANARNFAPIRLMFLPAFSPGKLIPQPNALTVAKHKDLENGNLEITTELKARTVDCHANRHSTTNATQFTTPFSAQTYQVRICSTLALWATIGSTAVLTANSAAAFVPANLPEYFNVTSGQVLNFISTSTSTGYVSLTEMS